MRKELPIVPAIFPMPVVLIATYNEDGTIDVMNAAWVMAYDYKEIKLNLAEEHRTTKNIRRTKAFSIALADASHVAEADYVGIVSNEKVPNKFEISGLHASKGTVVNAPVLEDFGVIMECEAIEVDREYGVLGKIKRLAVDDKYLDEKGKVDISKLDIIAYDPFNHGYYRVNEKVGQAFSDGRKLIKK